jgi:bifunctional non-homologous end joining protein LigD
MCAVALRSQSRARLRVSGARKAGYPAFIEPSDPTLREHAPKGDNWFFEIKADGYRAQLHCHGGKVTVFSRTGLDWTAQFSTIAAAASFLRKRDVVIDGEAVVYGNTGIPDFQQLRRELGPRKSPRVLFHAFDLLYLDGYDLRETPYLERKRRLEALLKSAPKNIVYVEYLEAEGASVFAQACKLGLEGVVAKRGDAPYRSGRVESWIKLKCNKSETFPIVAFVEKLGAKPRRIASLYVGKRENGKLLYAGKVRSGYTERAAREVRERLDPYIRKTSPLDIPVKKPKATWVEPVVDAEVEFSAFTDDGLLRAAVFKGLRDDLELPPVKAPSVSPAHRSQAKPHIGVPRENILQLLPDAVVPSKEQLAAYWSKVSSRALPYLARRPLKLVRHVHGTTFYHKGPLPKDIPAAVHQLKIDKREGGKGTRLWIEDLDGLLGLVALGAVELHPWNATIEKIEQADQLVIDLDLGEGVLWQAVIEAALRMRDLIKREGLKAWPKLTGGKGVHLMAPLERSMTHDAAHTFARRLVGDLAATDPAHYILSAQASRRGRIFLDYLRNGRGTTAVGTYSPRVRPGFPIAAPVTWKQIEAGIAPDAFSMDHPFRVHHDVANRPVRRRK